jgi:hypothetical protein
LYSSEQLEDDGGDEVLVVPAASSPRRMSKLTRQKSAACHLGYYYIQMAPKNNTIHMHVVVVLNPDKQIQLPEEALTDESSDNPLMSGAQCASYISYIQEMHPFVWLVI